MAMRKQEKADTSGVHPASKIENNSTATVQLSPALRRGLVRILDMHSKFSEKMDDINSRVDTHFMTRRGVGFFMVRSAEDAVEWVRTMLRYSKEHEQEIEKVRRELAKAWPKLHELRSELETVLVEAKTLAQSGYANSPTRARARGRAAQQSN